MADLLGQVRALFDSVSVGFYSLIMLLVSTQGLGT